MAIFGLRWGGALVVMALLLAGGVWIYSAINDARIAAHRNADL